MATPATPEARTLAWDHLKQYLREQETEHLRLLSMWVSELEPEFVYSRDAMQLIGVTVKGWRDVVFYAKGWTRSAQVSHGRWMMMFNPTHYARPPDFFHWGVDLGVETPDRSVEVTYDSSYKISVVVDSKDISPELRKKVLQATMPRVKK